MNKQIYKCCIDDDIELMHNMSYTDIDNFLNENEYILEELIEFGSWRVYNYLLSIFSITLKEITDIYECLINILKLEDVEDTSSYISLLFQYNLITEKEFHHYLYLYLDQENPRYHNNVSSLKYELELDTTPFNDYLYDIALLKEQVIKKMFKDNVKRQYENGLLKKILTY